MSLKSTFKRASIEAEMEFGSLEELAGYIGEKGVVLTKIFGDDMEIVVKGLSSAEGGTAIASGTVEQGGTETETTTGKKRGPKPKDKSQPDPSTAVAPPPAPIPGQNNTPPTPPAPVDTTPTANGIPAFLDRTQSSTPPAPPAPPPAPPAPHVVPPSGILAGKVIGALDLRAGSDEAKKQLVDWLASPAYGVVVAGSKYDDAIAAIRLMPDDKLASVATALAVA